MRGDLHSGIFYFDCDRFGVKKYKLMDERMMITK